EAVTGFTNADLSVAGGTLDTVSSGDGVTWTAIFTPSADFTSATNLVRLSGAGFTDAGGNNAAADTDSDNYAVDTARPTVTVSFGDTSLKAGETTLVTFTFSEAVTGFSNADLTVGNGTLDAVSSADGGTTWSATFTPTAGVTSASNVITVSGLGLTDLAGNTGADTVDSGSYAIDTAPPTVSILVADNALAAGESTLVTFTFSEAVSGFSNAAISIANGTLDAVSSADGGTTWTATFTPDADTTAAGNLISVDNTGYVDAAGNTGSDTTDSNDFLIDTAAPTVAITLDDSALAAGESALVTFTFSEAVTGFSNSAVTVTNGTLDAVSSVDGGTTWTATFTPTAGVTSASNVITVDNTAIADLIGNAGDGATASANFTIDSELPTVSIALADSALSAGQSSLVTFTFSEPVTGFSNANVSIDN
ncbi:Ig-like domain-containing protein, partial [Massilia glaciei]